MPLSSSYAARGKGLKFGHRELLMNESPNYPGVDLQLAQVDPPHPWRNAAKTVALAAVLLIAALAVFVYFVRRPPVAAGDVVHVDYYPVHSTIGGGGEGGMPGQGENYDQLLILARVRVRNQTNIPLFLQDISAKVTMPDGTEQTNVAASTSAADRVFQAFPDLAPLRSTPFDRDATVQPGQSTEGLAIFSFPITKQQWDSRKSATVVVSLIHQNDLPIQFPR